MKKHIDAIDTNAIKRAVENAEKKTAGEIVPVIIHSSNNYSGARWRLALLFAIISSFVIIHFIDEYFWEIPLMYVFLIEIFMLLPGFLLGKSDCLLRLFTHKHDMEMEVHRKAAEIFLKHNLHDTKDHTGVLIFVSVFERKAMVLGDIGIHKKLSDGTWNTIIKRMIEKIKSHNLTEAIILAVNDCGNLLAEHFPRKTDDTNELSDQLIKEK